MVEFRESGARKTTVSGLRYGGGSVLEGAGTAESEGLAKGGVV